MIDILETWKTFVVYLDCICAMSFVRDVMDGMMDNMDIRGGDSPSWGG
jgi:hypothetical protein